MAESQLRKGVIELVVLSSLDISPSYGGELLERLSGEVGLSVSPGTLYPLLARLRKAGLVETSWEESPVGPPRKIYQLSDSGHARLGRMRSEWDALTNAVSKVLNGKERK